MLRIPSPTDSKLADFIHFIEAVSQNLEDTNKNVLTKSQSFSEKLENALVTIYSSDDNHPQNFDNLMNIPIYNISKRIKILLQFPSPLSENDKNEFKNLPINIYKNTKDSNKQEIFHIHFTYKACKVKKFPSNTAFRITINPPKLTSASQKSTYDIQLGTKYLLQSAQASSNRKINTVKEKFIKNVDNSSTSQKNLKKRKYNEFAPCDNNSGKPLKKRRLNSIVQAPLLNTLIKKIDDSELKQLSYQIGKKNIELKKLSKIQIKSKVKLVIELLFNSLLNAKEEEVLKNLCVTFTPSSVQQQIVQVKPDIEKNEKNEHLFKFIIPLNLLTLTKAFGATYTLNFCGKDIINNIDIK